MHAQTPPHPTLDPTTRAALEALYAALCSAVVLVARALGRDSPLRSREERRRQDSCTPR